ncbi:kinesin-domain-containing protein [Pisolithus microcarpus]|nr:kinesin-domain-containing protein [Pisolithus microcarpus]
MSRLPRRLQTTHYQSSSPEPIPPPIPSITAVFSKGNDENSENLMPSRTMNKRKLDDQDLDAEALDQPRKLPALGSLNSTRPLAVSRTALNEPTVTTTIVSTSVGPASKPPSRPPSRLTRRDPPRLGATTKPRSTRATSAPPKPSGPPTRPTMSRIPSGPGVLACDMDAERAKSTKLAADDRALSRQLASAKELDLDKRRALVDAADELERMRMKHQREIVDFEVEAAKRAREAREREEELKVVKQGLETARETIACLKSTVAQQSGVQATLNAQVAALQAENSELRAQLDDLSSAVSKGALEYADAQRKIEQLENEAREAEMVRRKLHNMVQELKGNIRVFCRVRPVLPHDLVPPVVAGLRRLGSSADDQERSAVADLAFPDKEDHREIAVSSTSLNAMGQERKESYSFTFDRVFEPEATQSDVYEEISLLAQSCVDGYNVCIFAYGQTGSGKSFTMEGGSTEATVGMIPRAVDDVFRAAEALRNKGWEYKIEGQFLEIYNETINDLLGKGEFDKKKHEIKHEKQGGTVTTRVTDVNVLPLSTPREVASLLRLANSRRTVAATLMNERSSRSHSVFTLRVSGYNAHTGTRCEGCLNLVDLAGSERLNASGAAGDKDRLRETQNINRSLSALGDVIAALGEKSVEKASEKHVPYRNSKLTYLLQNSLSGNSKTLMILNLSPLAAHLGESLTSLRFATKVNNTTIGTARKQIRGSG